MTGSRPFDDDRWADQEGFACCFLCGRPVDPSDPMRGSYTPNHAACEALPVHLVCADEYIRGVDGKDPERLRIIAIEALVQMGEANVKMARRAAQVSVPEAH